MAGSRLRLRSGTADSRGSRRRGIAASWHSSSRADLVRVDDGAAAAFNPVLQELHDLAAGTIDPGLVKDGPGLQQQARASDMIAFSGPGTEFRAMQHRPQCVAAVGVAVCQTWIECQQV